MSTPELATADWSRNGSPGRVRQLLENPFLRSGVALAFLLSGLFKLSAFARETYIAARFGVSAATDAYYGLQQLPLSVATFMFGAFSLAFAPAYGQAVRRQRGLEWMPGLVFYGAATGAVLTAATVLLAPVLLGGFVGLSDRTEFTTLNILSACYVPVIFLGIWTSMMNGTGHPLRAMTAASLPYLTMTVALIFICEVTEAGLLSLPISMTIGFGVMGGVAAYRILTALPAPGATRAVLWPFQFPAFRAFGRQLAASAAENVGFVANQLLMIYFFGLIGTGAVTANNYAMRVGMLANSLITQPLAQLAQGKFCTAPVPELPRVLWTYLGWILGFSAIAVVGLFTFREHIVTLLYMHGRFTLGDVHSVSSLIPAWLAYFLVLSVNSVIARYMFVINKGRQYATYMLGGYLVTNLMRALWAGPHAYAPGVIWCAVIGEGAAMTLSLRTCRRATPGRFSPNLPLSVS